MTRHKDTVCSDADAYTVACPLCKSPPGFTCTYMPKLLYPASTHPQWDPQSGKPTRRPHIDRREAWWKKQRRDQDRRRRLERDAEAKEYRRTWSNSIPRSIREGNQREARQLVAWLAEHAHILTEIGSSGEDKS